MEAISPDVVVIIVWMYKFYLPGPIAPIVLSQGRSAIETSRTSLRRRFAVLTGRVSLAISLIGVLADKRCLPVISISCILK